jgi:hypothetical protein
MKIRRTLTSDILVGVATALAATWLVSEAAGPLHAVAGQLVLGVSVEAVLRVIAAT